MARQKSCWWQCNACGHSVWRGVVTGQDKPCPRCGEPGLLPCGGTNYRLAMAYLRHPHTASNTATNRAPAASVAGVSRSE